MMRILRRTCNVELCIENGHLENVLRCCVLRVFNECICGASIIGILNFGCDEVGIIS